MENLERQLAEKLLKINAIKLQPHTPFTWSSGWSSPIYCDNRVALSYPSLRTFIKLQMAHEVMANFPDAEVIAGVATGAIAAAALVADALGVPCIYVRSTPKDHGLENLIEGRLQTGQKVVVIDDLVSSGARCVKAIDDICEAGGTVVGALATFSFRFPMAVERFREAGVKFVSLSNYDALVAEALESGYISDADLAILNKWHENPDNWIPEKLKPLF